MIDSFLTTVSNIFHKMIPLTGWSCSLLIYHRMLKCETWWPLSFDCLGEIFELKAELNSDKKEKKKEAVKKVIASMTVGKDVR